MDRGGSSRPAYPNPGPPTSGLMGGAPRRFGRARDVKRRPECHFAVSPHGHHGGPCGESAAWWSVQGQMRWLRQTVLCRYSRDGSQDFLAGGSEGDGNAGGGHGGPKGEPQRPPPEPNHLHGQHAHACWASSLTATCCLPQVGQSKRGTLVFKCIRSVQFPARIRACSCPHSREPVRAPRSLVSTKCRA